MNKCLVVLMDKVLHTEQAFVVQVQMQMQMTKSKLLDNSPDHWQHPALGSYSSYLKSEHLVMLFVG